MTDKAKSTPLATVIIPTYGRPDMLSRGIESVLRQTYAAFEIIVVDDNDPESDERKLTEDVMSRYLTDERVRYLKHEKNKNGSAARNTGLRAAAGKYIFFLDDDDELMPEKISRSVERMESLDDSYGMCYSKYQIERPDGSMSVSTETREGDCYLNALMRTFYICAGSNICVKKPVADEVNGFDESFRRNQDIEFMARVLERYKIAYIDELLLTIHQKGSRTKRTFEETDSYAQYYLKVFGPRIDRLKPEDRERVIAVISLERFRVALTYRELGQGLRILRENHVKWKYRVRYAGYLFHRVVTSQSYGFDGT